MRSDKYTKCKKRLIENGEKSFLVRYNEIDYKITPDKENKSLESVEEYNKEQLVRPLHSFYLLD